MTTISVIVGSTRQGRFSEKPAQWASITRISCFMLSSVPGRLCRTSQRKFLQSVP